MRRKLSALLLTAVLLLSCGGQALLVSFQTYLSASGPLVDSLVASNLIPQSKAAVLIADFSDGAQCGINLQTDFDAIPKDLTPAEIKRQKFLASSKALQCFRVIVARQNFALHPRVQQAAAIAEGVLASLVLFYSGGSQRSIGIGPALAPHVVEATDEKDLERQLERKLKDLKKAMAP